MAHFAELDDNNVVLQVVVVSNQYIMGMDGNDDEAQGVAFCQTNISPNRWKQTSYNGNFRGRFAGIGFTYNEENDQFVPPSPYPSWSYNYTDCRWEPPVNYPEDGQNYDWDEDTNTWVLASYPTIQA